MPIIKNYGLRWVRDRVEWGAGKSRGMLTGQLAGARRSKPIDFRDQIGIYVLYEPGFVPVYIGQAGYGNAALFDRLKGHRRNHLRDRWTHFSWFGFRAVNQTGSLSEKNNARAKTALTYVDALNEIEGVLIEVLEPRLNKQGARWKRGAGGAKEFVQEGLKSERDRVEEIYAKLDRMATSIGEMKPAKRRGRPRKAK